LNHTIKEVPADVNINNYLMIAVLKDHIKTLKDLITESKLHQNVYKVGMLC
jgi:hypothetical protein